MSKRTALLLGLAAAALALVSLGRPWASGAIRTSVTGTVEITASGTDLGRLGLGLALVGAAALLAAGTGGLGVRIVSGVLAAAAGAGVVMLALGVVIDPGAALAEAGRSRTAGLDPHVERATATAWAWACLGAGMLLAVTGVAAALARSWQGLAAEYEPPVRPGTAASGRAAGDDGPKDRSRDDLWDSLTHGEDPT